MVHPAPQASTTRGHSRATKRHRLLQDTVLPHSQGRGGQERGSGAVTPSSPGAGAASAPSPAAPPPPQQRQQAWPPAPQQQAPPAARQEHSAPVPRPVATHAQAGTAAALLRLLGTRSRPAALTHSALAYSGAAAAAEAPPALSAKLLGGAGGDLAQTAEPNDLPPRCGAACVTSRAPLYFEAATPAVHPLLYA